MSTELTHVLVAPKGEAVELKHLLAHMREWKSAKNVGSDRSWELDGMEIWFAYRGPSKRDDLVNRIRCVFSSRQGEAGLLRSERFMRQVAKELGWKEVGGEDGFDPSPYLPEGSH